MFAKSLVFGGLLAFLVFQGMEAAQLPVRGVRVDARTVELRGLSDIIDELTALISELNKIVSGAVKEAWDKISGLIDYVKGLKDKFLAKGIGGIKDIVSDALGVIKNKTQEASKVGVDISTCLVGKTELITGLGTKLTAQVTACISDPVNAVVKTLTGDLKTLTDITTSVASLPGKLIDCKSSWVPIVCLTALAVDATALLARLPGQIVDIVSGAMKLVSTLTTDLENCVQGIIKIATKDVGHVIDEFIKCVDILMPGNTH